jgi:capsular polysaccharide biosynthesis protein
MEDHRLATIIWRGKWLVLLSVAAAFAVAFAATLMSNKAYKATTLLRVEQAVPADNGSDAYNAEQASQTQAVTYATLLTSPSFLNRIAPRIDAGFAFSGAGLASHVSAQAIKGTNLVAVNFKAETHASAVHYARVVASESIKAFDRDFTAARSRQQAAVGARVKAVAKQMAQLQTNTSVAAQQQLAALRLASDALTTEYGQVLSLSAAGSPVVLVSGPASAPADPVSPRPLFNLVAGLVVGLIIGVGLAWARETVVTS